MNVTLSPWLSRALALAILAALVSLVVSWIIVPLWDQYEDAQNALASYVAALSRATPSDSSVAALRAELIRLQKAQSSATGFLGSSNESLAAAELQNQLKRSVDAVQGDLRSTQILPPETDGVFQRVTIRGEVVLTLPELQRLVYALETTSPFLFLDNVDIRAYPTVARNGAPAQLSLLVRFDLAAYMRGTS